MVFNCLDVHHRLKSVDEAMSNEVPFHDLLKEVTEVRQHLAEQVPRLLALKVKDNSAGPADGDASNDALSSFREKLLQKANTIQN